MDVKGFKDKNGVVHKYDHGSLSNIPENGTVTDEQLAQAVADYLEKHPIDVPDSSPNVDLTGYATEKWVQEGYQPKGNYLTEHQDISGKLDADKLPEAIDDALAQAKASGEFDGPKGDPGYTPVKGKDYFDGDDYVLTPADKTEIAELAAELVEVPSGGIAVTSATVGQTVKISAVDDNGVPTAWEPVDLPSGGSDETWVLHETITTEAETAEVIIDAGEGKRFKKAKILISTGSAGLSTAGKIALRAGDNTIMDSNGHCMGLTPNDVNTWGYPVFMLECEKNSFPVCLCSNGGVTGAAASTVFMGGVYTNRNGGEKGNPGPWRYLKIYLFDDATFNEGVQIFVWGVYA